MSLTTHERHAEYPCIFDTLTVNHIRNVSPSSAVQRMIITPGGSVDPEITAEAFQDPTVRISSGDLGNILTACSPVNGMAISSIGEVQFQQRLDGGSWLGAGNHVTFNSVKGFLLPERIEATQDSQTGAEIALLYHALRSGSNAPFVVNLSQSLTGVPSANAIYKLSAVDFEGSLLRGHQSVAVTTGLTFQTKRDGGATSADVGSIIARAPTFEINGTNLSLVGSVGFGRAAMVSGITVYFEKVGTPPATPQHISFTLSAGDYVIEDVPVSLGQDANARLTCTGTGTLAYSTTATLP